MYPGTFSIFIQNVHFILQMVIYFWSVGLVGQKNIFMWAADQVTPFLLHTASCLTYSALHYIMKFNQKEWKLRQMTGIMQAICGLNLLTHKQTSQETTKTVNNCMVQAMFVYHCWSESVGLDSFEVINTGHSNMWYDHLANHTFHYLCWSKHASYHTFGYSANSTVSLFILRCSKASTLKIQLFSWTFLFVKPGFLN